MKQARRRLTTLNQRIEAATRLDFSREPPANCFCENCRRHVPSATFSTVPIAAGVPLAIAKPSVQKTDHRDGDR